MTVESQYKPVRYEGNGIAATFPFSWLCLDPAWVRATVTEAKVDVELTPGKDFSVALLADSPGGSVTLLAPLPQGKKITVWMSVPITQEHAYQNAGQLNVTTLEHAHDKHTLIDQILRADVDRSIKVPISSDDPPEILAELIFEARDQAYASAADAAASKAHAAASVETAAALLEEITTEHGAALGDIGAAKADALSVVTQLRDTSLADMTQLRGNTLDAVTREGQLQVGNVQQAASNVTLITTQAITDILDTGAQQEQRLRSVGDEQTLHVILEGNAQEGRVHASAAQATVEIAAQVQVASAEADRAKREADRAQDISNIGPASKTQRGWMIVGNGLRVDPDGKVHADIPSFLSLPVVGFSADVAIGYPATLSLSSETSIAGATVNRFMVVFDGAPAVEVRADTPGHATWTVTPTGTVHNQVATLIVTAYDSNGNASNDATITFTKKIVEVAAPLVLSPVSGAVDVALLPAITVQEGGTTGMPSTNEKTQVQIARDADFADIVWDSGEVAYASSVTVTSLLPDDAPLYIRARHKVSTYGWSAWGRASGFTTIKKAVLKPRILAPVQGALNQSLTSTITLSALQTTGLAPAGAYTQVQLARDAAFADVVWDSGDASAYGVSKATSNLPVNTYLYCRGRHNDSNLGWSAWADTVSFTTLNAYTEQPAVTYPANNAVDVSRKPTFQFSPISNVGPVDYGVETQIHVATDAGFASIIWNYQGGYLAQWAYPADFGIFTQYYVRVRHRGAAWGWSEWSDTVTFKTLNIYVNVPQVTSPANGATDVGLTPILQMSQPSGVNQDIDMVTFHIGTKPDMSDQQHLGPYNMNTQFQITIPLAINTLYYVQPFARGVITDWAAGAVSSFRTVNGWVNAPTLTSPVANATVAGDEVYFASSAFSVAHTTDTHVATEFALNKVVNGSDVGFWNSGELTGANLLAFKADIPGFDEGTQYKAYVRHKGQALGWSQWGGGIELRLTTKCFLRYDGNELLSSGDGVNWFHKTYVIEPADTYINGIYARTHLVKTTKNPAEAFVSRIGWGYPTRLDFAFGKFFVRDEAGAGISHDGINFTITGGISGPMFPYGLECSVEGNGIVVCRAPQDEVGYIRRYTDMNVYTRHHIPVTVGANFSTAFGNNTWVAWPTYGWEGRIGVSVDQGISWQTIASPDSIDMFPMGCVFINGYFYFIFASTPYARARCWRSVDGRTWELIWDPGQPRLGSGSFYKAWPGKAFFVMAPFDGYLEVFCGHTGLSPKAARVYVPNSEQYKYQSTLFLG